MHGTNLTASYERQIRKCEDENKDADLSDRNVGRRDDRGRVHVYIRDSGQQLSLAIGDLETRWRSVDVRHEEWPYGLEMVGRAQGRYAASKASYLAVIGGSCPN